ncbi:MAG: BtrH N-terminal domain-containing protein [Blastococcus sp.]
MTAQKHLKDAVRARMARTGEHYTTAHRHLTADRDRAPRIGVPACYTTFGGGRHHDSALLTNVLAAAGVVTAHDGAPLDEPTVAGLAGGIGFMYFSFSYAGELPTMTIVPRIHPRPFLSGALDRAGIAYRVAETTSAAKAARELDAALAAGRTPVCTVDRAALAHHAWADTMPGAEPYEVAVVGRRGDLLLLDDESLEPIAVPADAFAVARAGHRKSRNHMLVIEDGRSPVDVHGAVGSAVAVTVHDLTEDVMPGNFAGNFGLRGMTKWANAVGDRRGAKGWSRLFDSGPAFGHAMRRLHDCLTYDYSSPGAMRPLYAEFLTSAAALTADPALREAADGYVRAGELWAAIADAAVGGAMAPYPSLVERRLELQLDGGADAVEELRTVAGQVAALTAGLEVSEADRLERLDAIAELAARAVSVEEEACAALAGSVAATTARSR